MNTHSNALIAAAAAAPLIGLASALPRHYITRPVIVKDDLATDPEEEQITVKLVSLKEPKDEKHTHPHEGASDSQCKTDGKFTYFSEQPLPGAENDSILIEECDPLNPNQIRLAYVANKSFKNKLSPTSILIGCTSTSPKSFTARNGGAFTKVAPGTYTNFVKRNFVPIKTLEGKAAADNSEQLTNVERDINLARRWETRSDIDQYSDGYHTCRSAGSTACRLSIPKQVCPDLQRVLHGSLEENTVKVEKETNLAKRQTSVPEEKIVKVDGEEKKLKSDVRLQMKKTKEEEHNEFIKRWVQGDEHPRSFLSQSGKPAEEEVIIKKRGISPRESFKYDNLDARQGKQQRNHYHPHGDDSDNDDDSHYDHDNNDSCDGSDQYKPRCRNRALQQTNQQDQQETLQKARFNNNSVYSDNDDCSDASDANKDHCRRLREQGRPYTKRSEVASLQKRSSGVEKEQVIDKRDRYSDRYSVQSYQSRNSNNSRDGYRSRQDRMQKRSMNSGPKEDSLEKRDRNSSRGGRSVNSFNSRDSRDYGRNYRREVELEGEQAMVKRSNEEEGGEQISLERRSHHCGGRGRSCSPYNSKRSIKEDDADLVEKRSNHRGRGRSYSPHSRRGVDDQDGNVLKKRGRCSSCHSRRDVVDEQDGDLLEKRSNHREGRGRSYSPNSRRGLEEQDAGLIEKRGSHRGGWRGNSRSRSRRDVKDEVEVGVLKRSLATRDLLNLYDDAMTVRSALSEQGDIFERGQDSYNELIGKREVDKSAMTSTGTVKSLPEQTVALNEAAEKIRKRDLATSIWRLSVAPLLERRMNSATVFKRDVA